MKKKIVAIGGGENGRILDNGEITPYETEEIDKEIIKLTEKKVPNFLFLGHALASSIEIQESYYQTMKKIYGGKFKCNCQDLKTDELNDIKKVKHKLEWADIIYEGGGDTLSMINLWKKTGFDKLLYEAWNNGKVICGISAGAACWFKSCNSDSLENDNQNDALKFDSVDCLDWLHVHLTPHCDEPGRHESTKIQLNDNKLVGIMLSNCAALEILDDKYKLILSRSKVRKEAYAIKAYWDRNEYKEENIVASSKLQNIDKILDN